MNRKTFFNSLLGFLGVTALGFTKKKPTYEESVGEWAFGVVKAAGIKPNISEKNNWYRLELTSPDYKEYYYTKYIKNNIKFAIDHFPGEHSFQRIYGANGNVFLHEGFSFKQYTWSYGIEPVLESSRADDKREYIKVALKLVKNA